MDPIIGIDLGTTNSAAAWLADEGPKLIPNAIGGTLTPSIAGFEVERIFNEPTAAALAYGFHESKEDRTFLIFDLGGGTFDVSVVELFNGTLEVRASAGESFLGGEDFTRTMAARILQFRGSTFERMELTAPRLVSRL